MRKTNDEHGGHRPMDLVAVLHASMSELSATAWKVVSHVGYLNIRMKGNDPVHLVQHDIATATNQPPMDSEEISGGVFEIVPGLRVPYAKVSLQEFCAATGLSKSAVASAIKEAIAVEILERRKHRAPHHGDLPSLYRLNWHRLMESAKSSKATPKSAFRRGCAAKAPGCLKSGQGGAQSADTGRMRVGSRSDNDRRGGPACNWRPLPDASA